MNKILEPDWILMPNVIEANGYSDPDMATRQTVKTVRGKCRTIRPKKPSLFQKITNWLSSEPSRIERAIWDFIKPIFEPVCMGTVTA